MHASRNLTSRAVAERLGVHVRTVHRWVETGRLIPVVTVPGYRGNHLFDPDDVEALAAERAPQEASA